MQCSDKHADLPADATIIASADSTAGHGPRCVVLQCWDEHVDLPADATVIARVDDPAKYPEMKLSSWMQQLMDARIDCPMAVVHVCGRAPLSMMLFLGRRLCGAKSITIAPFTLHPFRAVPADSHRYGVRAMKLASRGDGNGPMVLYFTIKDQNRARFSDLPEHLNVRHILTVTPCDDADVILTNDNFDEVVFQSGRILREAIDAVVSNTNQDDVVYVATSAPAILAVLVGAVVECADLNRTVCLLERSHADNKYSVAATFRRRARP